MKNNNLTFIKVFLFFLMFNCAYAQETVVFSTTDLKEGVIEKGFASLNSSFLLDSDIKRPRNVSNEDRWAEMKVGAVRFPYGALGDNYLWDADGDWGNTLTPKIADPSKTPGNFPWAINTEDNTFKKAMDFDEFMGICKRKNIKPLIVVNILSYKYNNPEITYEKLKESAVEWVKYAKQKKYDVAYWQIGNEVDHNHNKKILTVQEYTDLYVDFVNAMKDADPSIKCGPGIINDSRYFRPIINYTSTISGTRQGPDLIDYVSAHQYLFKNTYLGFSFFKNYEEWLQHDGSDLNRNVRKMQQAVENSNKPNLPILITETNSFGNWQSKWAAMFKGLSLFDMLFTQQENKNVAYSFIWNSHSAWGGEKKDDGIANALFNDQNNEITAMGMPAKILNNTAEERIMIADNKVHGVTYSYGTYTASTGKATIYLLNKSKSPANMKVVINNYKMPKRSERWVWSGEPDLYSKKTNFVQTGKIKKTKNGFSTEIPPSSLVVIKLN